MNFEGLLRFAVEQGATDIHLQAGSMPQLRIGGMLRGVEGQVVVADDLETFLASLRGPGTAPAARVFARTIEGVGRFRCAGYTQMGMPGVVLRVLPTAVRSVEEAALPPVIKDIALARRGLTLVAGGSGSGRTSTLATMVDLIAASVPCTIVTVEEPVEYVFPARKAMVTQMESGLDVPTASEGIRQALRQVPDVLVVGELRDLETTQLALQAADSGHQVLATFPAGTATQALERVIAQVPDQQKRVALGQLAGSLEAVVAQRLAVTKDGKRRPVVQILRASPFTSRSINEGRMQDLANYLASRQAGMQTFEQHILQLYQEGVLSGTEALRLATNPEAVATELRVLRSAGSIPAAKG
jgi:twitching motility protein PilT